LLSNWFTFANTTSLAKFFSEIQQQPPLSEIQNTLVKEWNSILLDPENRNFHATSLTTRKFWHALVNAQGAGKPEARVHDFVVELFRLVFEQFNVRTRFVQSQPQYHLRHAAATYFTQADLVVVDSERDLVVLLQQDKFHGNVQDYPFAQAVAGAVAYFQTIQYQRRLNGDRPLAKLPILLGVCHGLEFSFMRLTMTPKMLLCVENDTALAQVSVLSS
jgi:hypothetical protein